MMMIHERALPKTAQKTAQKSAQTRRSLSGNTAFNEMLKDKGPGRQVCGEKQYQRC